MEIQLKTRTYQIASGTISRKTNAHRNNYPANHYQIKNAFNILTGGAHK